jgi:hypothetical protein
LGDSGGFRVGPALDDRVRSNVGFMSNKISGKLFSVVFFFSDSDARVSDLFLRSLS